MIRNLYRSPDGSFEYDLSLAQIAERLQQPEGLLWVDMLAPTEAEWRPILADTFRFHPLAIDDAVQETHVPKVDDYGEYLYVVVHGLSYQGDPPAIHTRELDAFLGAHFLITFHDEPSRAVEESWDMARRDERLTARGADYLLYDVLDRQVAHYLPVIDAIDEALDELEGEIFNRPTEEALTQIFGLKRATLQLRRILAPQREVLTRLARDEYVPIRPQIRVYFRDIYDHLVRLHDLAESLRDLASGALDTYLSVVSNRMNEVMKTLTIISAILLPLTLIAGIYGTNFAFVPEYRLRYGYPGMLVIMAMIAGGLLIYFRRRRWL